jgi:molecular chaperone DnaK
LKDADTQAAALDAVLLVGGSTRIPAVRDLVAAELGCEPRQEVHPELAVALGAAVSGALADGLDVGTVLVDVCPHSLGVAAVALQAGALSHDVFIPLIPRNTVVPVTRSEFFYTLTPDQTAVDVEVYQGEELVASRNTRLGEVRFTGLSRSADGGPREVLVHFDYDVNGILHVAAVDRRSDKRREVHLHTVALAEVAAPTGEEDILLQRLERLRDHVQGAAAQRLQALLEGPPPGEEGGAWREEVADFLLEHGGEY